MKLNFVLCPRFHGATTLALLLNNHADVSSLGDMFPSSSFDQSCGCGNKVSQCPFWRMVEQKFPAMHQPNSRSMYPIWPRLLNRDSANDAVIGAMSFVALLSTSRVWQVLGRAAESYAGFYVDFVNSVNEFNKSSVFVNGQKSLKSVLAIKSILGDRAQMNIIHLARDPRGFHCSENEIDSGIGIDDSARRWHSYHRRVAGLVRPLVNARYLAVRYEDLCEQPKSTMEAVFDFIGVDYQDVFRPSSLHHVVGHRSKNQFDGTLRQSLKWQTVLSEGEQERCLALTRPYSEKLGYNRVCLQASP